MESLRAFSEVVIQQYGYWGILSLTTLEHFIFPIPADVFIAIGTGNGLILWRVILLVLIGALVGSIIGYLLGKYLGHPAALWLFGKTRLEKGEAFIKKWGIWAVIISGLTPIPFKLMTWMAGVFEMPFKKFLLGVIIGRMPRYILVAFAGKFIMDHKIITGENTSAIVLGLLQGVTEFLPISSSGHLVIAEEFLKVPVPVSQLMTFDIFLHGGSLLAILIYFWRDWVHVIKEFWHMLKARKIDFDATLTKLVLATTPIVIVALVFKDYMDSFRNLDTIAIFFIVVGLFYFYSTWHGRNHHFHTVGLKKAVLIGLAQAIAILPGVSRSGSTISTAVLLGNSREAAARFSFLLGGVAIFAANVYTVFGLLTCNPEPNMLSPCGELPSLRFILTGAITAFLASITTVHFLLKFFQKYSLRPFGIYLILAGALILSFLWDSNIKSSSYYYE